MTRTAPDIISLGVTGRRPSASHENERGGSALDAASAESFDQVVLDEDVEDQNGNGDERVGGHELTPRRVCGAEHLVEADRERLHVVLRHDDRGVKEVVPRQRPCEDGGGDDSWQGVGKDDVNERLHTASAVDNRRLLQRIGDAVEELPEHPDAEREREAYKEAKKMAAFVDAIGGLKHSKYQSFVDTSKITMTKGEIESATLNSYVDEFKQQFPELLKTRDPVQTPPSPAPKAGKKELSKMSFSELSEYLREMNKS